MRIAFGAAIMILMASMPAYGQSRGGSSAANLGGSANGGGMGAGSISAPRMPSLSSTPRYSPLALAVSGSDDTFYPSTFIAFSDAVAQGKTELANDKQTIVEAAAASRKAAKQRARVEFVQDDHGNALVATH